MNDLDQHLAAIQGGDPDAFERWVAAAEATVRLGLRSFAAAVDTEAVLQETLLRTWQVAPRFVPDGRPNGLLRLAIRMARNLAISEQRRARTRPVDPALLDQQGDEVVASDPLLRQAIEDCRRKLEGRPAQALEARLAAAGAEPDEALAARLSMRLNTFLQNFTRARRSLADCLQRRGVDLTTELR
jgi:DNA-directed RNA polymerase specialized sigma24 family protein